MDFVPAIKSGFANTFKYTGRASRSEFWWFYLFHILGLIAVGVLVMVVAGALGAGHSGSDNSASEAAGSIFALLIFGYLLLMLFPSLSLSVRRLHDSDKSGFFLLISFLPFGGLVLLIFYCLPGTKGPNTHGADPLGASPLGSAATVARAFE